MAKTKISEYDATAANNTDIDSINIAEGMAPSNVNNAIRELMAHLKDGLGAGTPVFLDQTNNAVGIGTTSPETNYKLDVSGWGTFTHPSGDSVLKIQTGNTTGGSYIYFGDTADDDIGVLAYNHSSDYMYFRTNAAERMRIDSSGNVGIGTTSPSSALHISAANNSQLFIAASDTNPTTAIFETDAGSSERVRLNNKDGAFTVDVSNTSEALRIDSSGNVGISTSSPQAPLEVSVSQTSDYEVARFSNGALGSSFSAGAHITIGRPDIPRNIKLGIEGNGSSEFDGYLYCTETGGVLKFGTQNTERMRIDSVGKMFVGTASNPGSSNTGVRISGNLGDNFWFSATTLTSAYDQLAFDNGNGRVGAISTSGTSTSYNTTSDYRLKENVTNITDGITRIKQLAPKRFNFVADADTIVDGFIAHEAQTVVPEAVRGEKDAMRDEEYEVTPAVLDDDGNVVTEAVMGTRSVPDYQGIDQSKLVPLLTAALQEAIAKIETLETKVAALESA